MSHPARAPRRGVDGKANAISRRRLAVLSQTPGMEAAA